MLGEGLVDRPGQSPGSVISLDLPIPQLGIELDEPLPELPKLRGGQLTHGALEIGDIAHGFKLPQRRIPTAVRCRASVGI